MKESSLTCSGHVHLVGVAGVGMSAVAQVLLGQRFRVSGSDRYLDQGQHIEVLGVLERAGCELVVQDGRAIQSGTTVVVSTAIEQDNPEIVAAKRVGADIVHRAEMLARVINGRTCVAVGGTSGKTTVTGMIGWVLEQAGRNPTVVNGGIVPAWQADDQVGNVRLGSEDFWVIEADESDRSFLHFDPDWAVITNISEDHFALAELTELFQTFASRARKNALGGPGVSEVLGPAVQVAEARMVPDENRSPQGFTHDGYEYSLSLPGRHNIENAMVTLKVCEALGVELSVVRRALASFPGIRRRLECAGEVNGIRVFDDYAHNPAKIEAAWSAVAEMSERVLGVWRPHGFGPLAAMGSELTATLARTMRPEDRLWVLPVYYAGGTATGTLDARGFVEMLNAAGVRASCAEDYDSVAEGVCAEKRVGDVILSMGARDPGLPAFARRLVELLKAT